MAVSRRCIIPDARRPKTTAYGLHCRHETGENLRCAGQRPSEVHEILHGRQVRYADVLERICDGFGVPRGWMRLAYAEDVVVGSSETVSAGQGRGMGASAGFDPTDDQGLPQRALHGVTAVTCC